MPITPYCGLPAYHLPFSLPLTPPQIISILAFSITAGFTNSPNNNSLTCTTNDNVSRELNLEFNYPFRAQNFKAVYIPFDDFIEKVTRNESSCRVTSGFDTRSFAGFAQFFVAMGVLSFLYCLGILCIYVLFINPQLPFAKWIIVFVSFPHFSTTVYTVPWACTSKQITSYPFHPFLLILLPLPFVLLPTTKTPTFCLTFRFSVSPLSPLITPFFLPLHPNVRTHFLNRTPVCCLFLTFPLSPFLLSLPPHLSSSSPSRILLLASCLGFSISLPTYSGLQV